MRRSYGSLVMLASLPGQRRVHHLPTMKLHKLRDARFRRIVTYAVKTVPFYREYFQENRLSLQDFRSTNDLRLLPLISKKAVGEHPERFRSESKKGQSAIQFQTSGSTGTRLSVWLDRDYLLAQASVGVREREVIRRFIGREFRYKELLVSYPTCTPEKIWAFYREAAFTPIKAARQLCSVSKSLRSIFETMDDMRPDVLIGEGSFLEFLFRKLLESKLEVYLPKLVRYGADSMSPEGRELIERTLGIPVVSNYGAVECLKIGFECGEGSGYHLHEDLCHVRIIKRDGEEAPPGTRGEVVVSNLMNRGTVLLNYRLGDLATLSTDTCSCGRTTSLLSELDGRVEDIITLENGDFVHPRLIWSIFKHESRVLQYQLTQETPEEFKLKLVTDSLETFKEVSPSVLQNLKLQLGSHARIECTHAEELTREGSGKFRPVRSLWNPRKERDSIP